MDPYVTATDLKANVQDNESSGTDSWEILASAVSRLFDREAEVSDGFFLPAPEVGSETVKTVRTNGTEFLSIGPYIAGSITALTVDAANRLADGTYYEKDGYLVFSPARNIPEIDLIVVVTARFGLAATPSDVQQACIEQALLMWRRKDLSFTDLSGVTSGLVSAKFSPTFQAIATRYRGLYGQNSYFG